ncbi:hypothetical protein ACTJI8_12920 [Microbacterium sp. 22303]|uniref:hypothetical protein n=1 Tax=Microbacterium sp. 22303 TaxID=3453905 RepID=UPI003F852FE0
MTRSDALADFVEMTAERFERDFRFRLRLLAEADETVQETMRRIAREKFLGAQRRTAS